MAVQSVWRGTPNAPDAFWRTSARASSYLPHPGGPLAETTREFGSDATVAGHPYMLESWNRYPQPGSTEWSGIRRPATRPTAPSEAPSARSGQTTTSWYY